MTRNTLKIIACVTMLIDHIGVILFPDILILRLIGRTAMPLFAFFIGEGCIHTRNRKKYFLQLFILGLICQCAYIAESLITKSGNGLYLNILLTFSCSVILCCCLLNFLEAREKNENKKAIISGALFLVLSAMIYLISTLPSKIGIPLTFDYGFGGIILPIFVLFSKDKKGKLLSFSLGLILMVFTLNYSNSLLSLCSFIPLILLFFYNGKNGKTALKWSFYLFYPLHLAILYLISLLI